MFFTLKATERIFHIVENMLTLLLLEGQEIEGAKSGTKRTSRKYLPEALEVLEEHLGADAYKKELISLTQAKKAGIPEDLLNSITYKPEGASQVVLSKGGGG